MSFVESLEAGRNYEGIVLDYLAKLYPNIRLAKNELHKGIDLVSPYGLNAEIKFDMMMEKTGNLYIEFECNGKPSGIYYYDYIHMFIYGNNSHFYLFNGNKLKKDIKRMIESKEYRIVKGGDGWRTKGVLIPEKDLLEKGIAVRKFTLI